MCRDCVRHVWGFCHNLMFKDPHTHAHTHTHTHTHRNHVSRASTGEITGAMEAAYHQPWLPQYTNKAQAMMDWLN